MKFSDFEVGQYVAFNRRFSDADYARFIEISGDANPLHGDEGYAAASEFGARIVPLALAVSPFSAVAGMALPGTPSLILSQRHAARQPVLFERDLTYSARIAALSPASRTLELSLRLYDGCETLVEGRLDVRARADAWQVPPETPDAFQVKHPCRIAFVTGADGAIGGATAQRLERAGWEVYRQSRRSAGDHVLQVDFRDPVALDRMAARLEQIQPSLVVHCASARVEDGVPDLVASNYQALHRIVRAVLPGICARQQGRLLTLGSVAQQRAPLAMFDYGAAKAQTTWLLDQLRLRYATEGLTAVDLLCDRVETAFSEGLAAASGVPLDPEEVAEHVAALADRPAEDLAPRYRLDSGGLRAFDQAPAGEAASGSAPSRIASAAPAPQEPQAEDEIAARLRTVFETHLPDSRNVAPDQITMQGVSGWDSMKQIILALEVEKSFGVSLATTEIASLSSFQTFREAVARGLEGRAA